MNTGDDDKNEFRSIMEESRRSVERVRSEVERLAELLELQSLKGSSRDDRQMSKFSEQN